MIEIGQTVRKKIMTDTAIYKALAKIQPSWENEYMLEELFKFPEGEWFNTSNLEGNSYTICDSLNRVWLLASRREPIWDKGSFYGEKVYFMYKKDLNYNIN